MLKFLTFLTVALLAIQGFAKVTISDQGDLTRYHFSNLKVKTQNVSIEGQTFTRAKLQGASDYSAIHYKLGMPEVPAIRFYTPKGEVKITFNEAKAFTQTKVVKNHLVPNLESLEKIAGAKIKLIINKSFQKSKSFYPTTRYEIKDAGTYKGTPQQLISVYPLTWNPSLKSYKLVNNFTVTVKKNLNKAQPTNEQQTFAFIIGREFKNSPSIARYEEFKKQLGFNVIRINIEGSVTNPEQIRAKLQELLANNNLKYALIFGDAEHVPSKRASNISGVTDHYYRAIDTNNYGSDINGPDIGVGRVTIKNESELEKVVNKFIKYQTADFSNEDWLGNVSFIATDDKYEVAEGSHNHAIDTYMTPHGYSGVFPDANQAGGDKLYAITYRVSDRKVVETMNLGRTIINYSGHGGTRSWAGPDVSQNNVRSLNHGDALPFVISNACITGQFTVSESFGETWLKHPNGAIMFWGSMDSSYWDEDDYLEKDMYKGIYELDKREFSEITSHAMRELWRIYGGQNRSKYYWETYVTFGDPSIKLRTDYTKTINLSGPASLPMGITDLEYELTYINGNPVTNAIVSINIDGISIASSRSDANGTVNIELPAETNPGDYKVIIYGNNTRVEEHSLSIIAADAPFIILKDIQIAGQSELTATPFQELTFHMDLKNVARMPTRGGKIEIAKIDGPATIISEKAASIPSLDPGVSYSYTGDQLKLRINDAANQEKITVHFKWKTNEGQEGFSKVSLKALRGITNVTSLDFGNIQNPDSGGIRPGDSGNVFLTIKNTGDAPMDNINLYPEVNTCIQSIDGAIFIEKLAPGESFRSTQPLFVTLKSNCQADDIAIINLLGNYGSCTQVDVNGNTRFNIGRYGIDSIEENLNLSIPDKSSVTFPFQINGRIAAIKDIGVHLKIEHTYIGDLSIFLVHPDGTQVKIINNAGGSSDNLDLNVGMGGNELPDLANFNGKSAQGQWKLIINDDAGGDVGTLKYVKVKIKGLME